MQLYIKKCWRWIWWKGKYRRRRRRKGCFLLSFP